MNLQSDKNKLIIKKIEQIYIICSLIVCVITRIMPIKYFIGENLNTVVFNSLALAGILLIVWDIITTGYWKRGTYINLLYLFIAIMLISSVVNVKYGVLDNIKTIVWMCILVCVIYTFSWRCTKIQRNEFLIKIWIGICSVWIFPVLYSIGQFVTLEKYTIIIEGKSLRQGFFDNRLFGVFNDPNYAAVMSVYIVCACIYLWQCKTSRIWRVFLGLNVILQSLYIVLSGSRTAIVCSIITISFVLCVNAYKSKNITGIVKRVLIIILIPVLVSFSTVLTQNVIKKASMILPITYIVVVKGEHDYHDYLDKTLMEREDVRKDNISNNRGTIWQAYLQGLKGDYFLGGSPRNVLKKWQSKDPKGYLALTGYETHNAYIHILVGTGIIGLGVVLLYMILVIRKLIHYIITCQKISREILFCGSVLLTISVYIFFFSDLFFVYSLTSVLFWLHCGMMMNIIDES